MVVSGRYSRTAVCNVYNDDRTNILANVFRRRNIFANRRPTIAQRERIAPEQYVVP